MKKPNDLIGKVLAINEMQIERAETALKKVLPAVQAVIGEYNKLVSLPPFNQKVWATLLADDGKGISNLYSQQAEDDLKGMKNPAIRSAMLQNVGQALQPLTDAIEAAKKAIRDASLSQTAGFLNIRLDDIHIAKGRPEISLDRVKDAYTFRIQTEAQADLYIAGKQAELAMNELRRLLEGTSSDPAKIGWGCGPGRIGVFEYDINTDTIAFDVQCIADAKEEPEATDNA